MNIIDWLLEGPPWVRYRTLLDLAEMEEDSCQVLNARQEMINHPQIKNLITDLQNWPGSIMKNHKNAGHEIHKLSLLAEFGIRRSDPGMKEVVQKILTNVSEEGPFTLLSNYPAHFGGSGQDEMLWILCDAPLILYSLICFGLGSDPQVNMGLEYLCGLVRENGWPCAAAKKLGRFHGPGRRDDPCPYANLLMLKTLGQSGFPRENAAARTGIETLLNLWRKSRERSPYLFKMGTDFRKLKAPFVWYDILHFLEVLSKFPSIYKDPRFREIAYTVKMKADQEGKFTPESVWLVWKDWDFGKKKEPSYWLTFLVYRALKRSGQSLE